MSAQCKGCGAQIIWAVTEAGKRIPLDETPQKRIILVGHLNVEHGNYNEARVVNTYQSHFVTCPKATEFRSKP